MTPFITLPRYEVEPTDWQAGWPARRRRSDQSVTYTTASQWMGQWQKSGRNKSVGSFWCRETATRSAKEASCDIFSIDLYWTGLHPSFYLANFPLKPARWKIDHGNASSLEYCFFRWHVVRRDGYWIIIAWRYIFF